MYELVLILVLLLIVTMLFVDTREIVYVGVIILQTRSRHAVSQDGLLTCF